MDDDRFDALVRSLAARRPRRSVIRAALAASVAPLVAPQRRARAQADFCQETGEPCAAWVRCCGGVECVTLPTNPNAGFCGGFPEDPTPSPPPPPPASPPLSPPPPPPPVPPVVAVGASEISASRADAARHRRRRRTALIRSRQEPT